MAGQANDTEKLPWLEPYREPAPTRAAGKSKTKLKAVETPAAAPAVATPPPARKGVPLAAWLVTGIAVVGLAAGGGYWAGHRTAPDAPTAAPTVTIPVAKVDPIPMPEVEEPAGQPAPVATGAPAAAPRVRRAAPSRRVAAPHRVVRTATPPARPEAAPPLPKIMSVRFSPPPSAGVPGTVVDLGRYLSPKLADAAYRRTLGRYPYLARLPKVVAPQPVVYGEPRLYALNLGAKNGREARQLCDNLKKIGRPCVVR
jgi:hypothetical protein